MSKDWLWCNCQRGESCGSIAAKSPRCSGRAVRSSCGLRAPVHATIAKPKVRLASVSKPYRRGQGWATFLVQDQIPARCSLFDQEKFDLPAAPTRAAHPNTPVCVVVPRQHEGPERQPRRQAVSTEYLKTTSRCHEFEQPQQQPLGIHANAFDFGVRRAGSPRSGSKSPRANCGMVVVGNDSTGKNSSSFAARLNCVLAYAALDSWRNG